MQITAFKAADFFALVPQPAQAWVHAHVTHEQLLGAEGPNSFTGWVDGQVVGCWGWFEVYPTRAVVWSYLGRDAGPHFTPLHRACKALVDSLPHKRIETEVDWDFEAGHRWMRLLGFELEAACLRGYRADGGDAAIYARVK